MISSSARLKDKLHSARLGYVRLSTSSKDLLRTASLENVSDTYLHTHKSIKKTATKKRLGQKKKDFWQICNGSP